MKYFVVGIMLLNITLAVLGLIHWAERQQKIKEDAFDLRMCLEILRDHPDKFEECQKAIYKEHRR